MHPRPVWLLFKPEDACDFAAGNGLVSRIQLNASMVGFSFVGVLVEDSDLLLLFRRPNETLGVSAGIDNV